MLDTRLDDAVLRGEIDNTRRHVTYLSLWILGETQPIRFELQGDCLKDLAGSHITFRNNETPTKHLNFNWNEVKNGFIGCSTASERVLIQEEKTLQGNPPPSLVHANLLRVEFFCEIGRFILELNNFSSNLISKDWSLSDSDEFAQYASNASLWRQHISACSLYDLKVMPEPLADLYDEISSRVTDCLDYDQYEAFLMSWDGIMAALSEENTTLLEGEYDNISELSDLPEEIENYLIEELEKNSSSHSNAFDNNKTYPILESLEELIDDLNLLSARKALPLGRVFLELLQTLEAIKVSVQTLLNTENLETNKTTNLSLESYKKPLGLMMQGFAQLSYLLEITESPSGRNELIFIRDSMLDLRDDISELRFQVNKF